MLRSEFMEPLGLSARALAAILDVPPNRITGIIKERRGVTANTALRLSRHFGTSSG
jgi:addiction module HigA family antidote